MLKTDTSRSPKLTMPGAPKMDPELFSQDGGLGKHLEKVGPSMAAKSEEFSKLDSAWARYEFLRRVRIHSRYLLFYSIEIHTNRKKTAYKYQSRSNSWCHECPDDFGLVEKDLSKAIELKEKGNELFKTNQLMEAKDFYTDALRYCPFDEKDALKNQEYSIILANRSAVTDKEHFF